jgi:hypothetical protein
VKGKPAILFTKRRLIVNHDQLSFC